LEYLETWQNLVFEIVSKTIDFGSNGQESGAQGHHFKILAPAVTWGIKLITIEN